MMPRIATVMITVLCLTPALVTAQEPQCNNIPFPGATTACNTAVDAVRAFYPLAGMIVSGGNPVLGRIGALDASHRATPSVRDGGLRPRHGGRLRVHHGSEERQLSRSGGVEVRPRRCRRRNRDRPLQVDRY